jgi:RNA polymerase sigma factor (sigma-70 family)
MLHYGERKFAIKSGILRPYSMSAKMKKKKISEFFRSEYKNLVRFVRRRIDQAAGRDAEDIVQDVMVNLFDRADLTIPLENLSAYIYRSLRNRVVDIFRKGKNEVSLDAKLSLDRDLSLTELVRDVSGDTAASLEKEELYARLYEAVESLDEKDRAIIIATDFDGVSFRRLSEEWAVPMGTLLARKSRALKKIKKKLADFTP